MNDAAIAPNPGGGLSAQLITPRWKRLAAATTTNSRGRLAEGNAVNAGRGDGEETENGAGGTVRARGSRTDMTGEGRGAEWRVKKAWQFCVRLHGLLLA